MTVSDLLKVDHIIELARRLESVETKYQFVYAEFYDAIDAYRMRDNIFKLSDSDFNYYIEHRVGVFQKNEWAKVYDLVPRKWVKWITSSGHLISMIFGHNSNHNALARKSPLQPGTDALGFDLSWLMRSSSRAIVFVRATHEKPKQTAICG